MGWIRQNLNPILTMVAVVVALTAGILMRNNEWSKSDIAYMGFPGEMFLRALKLLIIPLITSSLIASLGTLDPSSAGRIASRAAVYYLITTCLSIGLGLLLVLTIRPGDHWTDSDNSTVYSADDEPMNHTSVTSTDAILDLMRNLIPENLIEAGTHHYASVPDPEDPSKHEMKDGTNILGLVTFSVMLGVVCSRMRAEGKPIVSFMSCLSEASMGMTRIVIFFTPVGVLFLVLARVLEVKDVNSMLQSVGLYTACVLSGLLIHSVIVLPLLYLIVVRRNPFRHVARMSPALLTAVATSSSCATMPVTINCLEEKMGLDPSIVRFIVPVGATVNMDGTALYEAVAAVFIAQSRGLHLAPLQLIVVAVTATFASIGAAGIPQAGLVTMVVVLNAVGMPASDVYLILVVDWFLDRFRTVVNVLGDSFATAVISHLCTKGDDSLNQSFDYDFPSRNNSTKKKDEKSGSTADLTSVKELNDDINLTANGNASTNEYPVLEKSPKLGRGVRESEH